MEVPSVRLFPEPECSRGSTFRVLRPTVVGRVFLGWASPSPAGCGSVGGIVQTSQDRQAALLTELSGGLDTQGDAPLYAQLREALRRAVAEGRLRPGDPLPTVRALAAALGLAPNTVSRAYTALGREGLTENRAGAGTVVAAGAWTGRLDHQAALRELRARLGELLAAGVAPEQLREVLEEALRETR